MGFFFSIGKNCLHILKSRLLCVTIFLTTFVIGVMCGVVLKKQVSIEKYYLNYAGKYLSQVFTASIGGIILKRMLSALLFLAFSSLLCVSPLFVPLQCCLLFCKGFAYGALTVALFSTSALNGFFVFLLVLLPQTICFAAIGSAESALFFDYSLGARGDKRIGFLFLLLWGIICFSAMIALECLTSLLVFRLIF